MPAILSRSLAHIGAYAEDVMIGFVNVAWDGGKHAFILDTCVHRHNQRQGVATGLGAVLAALPAVGLTALLVWLLTAFCFRYSSLAALVAASAAARIIPRPPEAWTFSMNTPRRVASRTAPATVLGMSWNLRSRKTWPRRSRISRMSGGPQAVNSSIPTLNRVTRGRSAATSARMLGQRGGVAGRSRPDAAGLAGMEADVEVTAEPESTYQLYGQEAKKPGTFAHAALLARRMVERGVRFVQCWSGAGQPWDNHDGLEAQHKKLAGEWDRPIAAFLDDLKARGLFGETLVLWGGEFGRTPVLNGGGGKDHWPYGSALLVGSGVAVGAGVAVGPPTRHICVPSQPAAVKQGVKWHDGQDFSADDVVFNWEYARSPTVAAVSSGSYRDVNVVKVDDHTVRVEFQRPTPFWADAFVGSRGSWRRSPIHLFAVCTISCRRLLLEPAVQRRPRARS